MVYKRWQKVGSKHVGVLVVIRRLDCSVEGHPDVLILPILGTRLNDALESHLSILLLKFIFRNAALRNLAHICLGADEENGDARDNRHDLNFESVDSFKSLTIVDCDA